MPVTSADVLHVAALARLRLSPDEVERLAGELSDILGHVAELVTADSAGGGAEPLPATTWPAPLRSDAVPAAALAIPPSQLAPTFEHGFFTVPRLGAMEAPPP